MDTVIIDKNKFKRDYWTEKENSNAELIMDFVQNIMNNHDFEYVKSKYDNSNYVQHNRGIPDKMMGVIEYVKKFAGRFPEFSYDVKSVYVDGDYVTLHSHATIKKSHRGNDKKGMNIVDTWRINGSDIEEHWDAIQPLDTFMRFYTLVAGGAVRNSNGVF
ncbi:nuclear transport factor 2 family protein [Vibrio nigripulchritudo]|uniref:nuclear transport factor 2 family protein n=1 Tax=Vibrio nigripulchritudo TaxID=28173 RepID=UPI0024927478|nr:ester cyclase [Vibrio nigripulchritudo]BDU39835.1 hypothetical protein TUMSATVNIG2_43040 [Vibrio nigripulchritudo]BDU45559.1 hypothetical protein TUMSATVNIG3_43570 [Vibrio nigripulchritudo]